MRICLIGKFPPIQGGVSMRTYWTAHRLAERGHEVHVVTNAREVRPPFRMFMREEDWSRCAADYGAGRVVVHWTDPIDRSQFHIPTGSPYVTKLAALACRAHAERPFDVVHSYYLEPYGVAGHLVAQILGIPHVVRLAGSDSGRLWHHPQFEPLYDHLMRAADIVLAGGAVAERAIARGVDPDRIASGGGIVVPEDLFAPEGPSIDFTALRREVERDPDAASLLAGGFAGGRPYFGIYGKLGETKGSFALLAALRRLVRSGHDIGLVALAHGRPAIEATFRSQIEELGLRDHVLQLPFLPHWRVPEFLRGCLAVCCLEQDFPIEFHTPIVATEVLLSGTCLVASTEIIRKLPGHERLADGYDCVAIDDVRNVDALTSRLSDIVRDPGPTKVVGARGRAFARAVQKTIRFPQMIEETLAAAAARRPITGAGVRRKNSDSEAVQLQFRVTRQAADSTAAETADLTTGQNKAAASEPRTTRRELDVALVAEPSGLKSDLVTAVQRAATAGNVPVLDPLFRLRTKSWALTRDGFANLVPVRFPSLIVEKLSTAVPRVLGLAPAQELDAAGSAASYLVVFHPSGGEERNPLIIDDATARLLDLCDGTRTCNEILLQLEDRPNGPPSTKTLAWIETLFEHGLLAVRDESGEPDARDWLRTRSG